MDGIEIFYYQLTINITPSSSLAWIKALYGMHMVHMAIGCPRLV